MASVKVAPCRATRASAVARPRGRARAGQPERRAVGGLGRASSSAVVGVRPPRHPGPALARDPDDGALDAGVQIAAAPVLGEEVLEPGAEVEPATY